jgi:HPt (histidine-containing phosphotransfer) domain-containing protein
MAYKFINSEYLDSVSGGDTDVIREIVDIFREQVIEMFHEMKSHNADGKYISLGLLAHKAKSSVSIMGMNDLALMLKKLEIEAKEGRNADAYESYIERFGSETRSAITELDDLIKNRSGQA